MNGIILAGGRGKRIATEKPFIDIGGEKIIKRLIDIFSGLFDETIVVTNSPEQYADFGVTLVRDVITGKGPLVGIYSGLLKSTRKYNFMVACDMPFIHPELIKYMGSLIADYDLIVPKIDGYYEPLHAIYSKNCLDKIVGLIENKRFKIQDMFKAIKTRLVSKEEVVRYDPCLTSFFNINSTEDLKKAEKMADTVF